MAWVTPTNRSTGDLMTAAIWNQDVVANPIALAATGLQFLIDGGGAAITTGIKMDLVVLAKADINSVTLLADQSGSIVLDLWKDTYANFPPTVADTITAAAKPTISVATKSQDSTLTGWTKAWAEGDIIRVNVDSVATIQRVTCALDLVYT
jgi:hypothetical protein